MKRMYKLLLGFVAIATLSMFIGCEGPEGPAGADGTDGKDGVDGEVTCMTCHSENTMASIQGQFAQSIHKQGDFVDYAGGRSYCAECHSHEGFVEFAEFGDVDGNISSPSAWECGTCHGLHSSFDETDYALRLTDAVAAYYDETVTIDLAGNSNLCVNCHQARRAEPNISDPGTEFEITSTHYGPHHGPQSNLLAGITFAEIAGDVAYPTAGSATHMTVACTGCHMDTYTDGEGGHTWHPTVNSCTGCHAGAESFDIGGFQTEIQGKLDELRDLLMAEGVIEYVEEGEWEWDPETGEHVEVNVEGEYHPVPGTYPMIQVQAFYNWVGIAEDRSLGVHNPGYIEALLDNSIKAMQ